MAANAEIPGVLTEAIEGLVRADALRLVGLREAARDLAAPADEREWMEAVRLHRAFGRLLVLTRRNLRLVRMARGVAGGYEPERG
ncbi:MAG TPA: hypothetical protein VHX37_03680 [Acidobacteriaceae bacterium]|jgi:hypothetical protein|nr:hypothetical protein [Acidobacteriaceae bacterium]